MNLGIKMENAEVFGLGGLSYGTVTFLNEKTRIIYNTNLMQADIPILVTKNKTNADNLFRNPSPSLFQKLKTKRAPTVPKFRNNEPPNRHQTLDPE